MARISRQKELVVGKVLEALQAATHTAEPLEGSTVRQEDGSTLLIEVDGPFGQTSVFSVTIRERN